jgi:DNA-binding transcriptional LysR family regulator
MREMNLHGVDLNLLPALEALLRRRNVSQAAVDAGLSQPAMSRALARLRDLFDDPLLVRVSGGFALSPKAEGLLARVHTALDDVTHVFAEPIFDPALVQRRIRFAATDLQTILYAPALMARLAKEAPGIDVSMEPYSSDLTQRMENGSLDFVFALATTPLPSGALSESLGQDRLALVMRRGHPAENQKWTIKDYGRFNHASIGILGDGISELDAKLAMHGVKRRIALTTPHFIAALAAVSASDMVTTISENFASRFAKEFNLTHRPPPLKDINLNPTLVWSHVRSSDKVLTWVRGVVRDVCRAGSAETSREENLESKRKSNARN